MFPSSTGIVWRKTKAEKSESLRVEECSNKAHSMGYLKNIYIYIYMYTHTRRF